MATNTDRTRLGAVSVAQLVVLELACAAVFLASGLSGDGWLIAAACAAGLVLLPTFGWLDGRWWYAAVRVWWRLRRRRRWTSAVTPSPETAVAVGLPGTARLAAMRPAFATISERGGNIGVAFDGTGWFTALSVTVDEDGAVTPAEILAGVLSRSGAPVSSLQILSQSVPAPSTALSADVLCAQSYRELLDGFPTVANREDWLVARLDVPDAAAFAAGRGGGVLGVHRALSATVSRIAKAAEGAGIRVRPLGEIELDRALRQSIGGETVAATIAENVAEHWDSWTLGTLAQVGYALHGRLPEPELVRRLWTAVTGLPVDFTAVSVTMRRLTERRGDTRLAVRCVVRVAMDADLIADVTAHLDTIARTYRIRLRRLDGEQGPAVYASALTGG